MEVFEFTATQFIKALSTGRNHPLLLGCENSEGEAFEVVVKFRGKEMSANAQIAELVSAQLADALGLQVPQCAIVNVPVGFDAILNEKAMAAMVKSSLGLNFGSVHLGTGFTTWPPGREPYGTQRDQAGDIFAFDTLIQNPDRRPDNPNLWARTDRLGVYDHEQAFSFLDVPIIGGSPKPWAAANQGNSFRFLENHVFYRNLRGGRVDLGPFKEKLGALTDEQINCYSERIPPEWRKKGDFCQGIVEYIREARTQRETLIQFIQHLLR